MSSKKFHLGDILSVTTGLVLSPAGITGIQKLLSFMIGEQLQLMVPSRKKIGNLCKKELLIQYPQFAKRKMKRSVTMLIKKLETVNDQKDKDKLIADWLAGLAIEYGEMLTVRPISKELLKPGS